MKSFVKKMSLCIALFLQGLCVFANPGDSCLVNLTFKNNEDLVIHTKPHKAPVLQSLLPCVYWCNDNSRLTFVSGEITTEIEYEVLDMSETVVTNGVINYDVDGVYSVILPGLPPSQYVVRVTLAGMVYEGTFYVY